MRERLRQRILELPIGAAISSERDLALEYGVSRMTARRAVIELTREGLLDRHVGRGTFVSQPRIELRLSLNSFSEDMRARGKEPGAIVLDFSSKTAGQEDPFAPGTPLITMTRIRTGDGTALAIEETHLDASLVPGYCADDARNSLYETLSKRYGLRLDSGEQRIIAVECPAEIAASLGTRASSPVICMDRKTLVQDRLVEHTISWYRADSYQFTARLLPAQE
jgi:transcriptional regulator, gntR family